MTLNRRDLTEFVGTLKWFVGRGKRPAYGRWTYWKKFDYFAVFWGIAVIGSTGLTLWFPVFFTRFLPGWLLNVTTIIHSDEALLATGFILPCISSIPICGRKSFPWTSRYSPAACRWKNWNGTSPENMKNW
jgi:cytochrome b subunit of formate dehydrogenase